MFAVKIGAIVGELFGNKECTGESMPLFAINQGCVISEAGATPTAPRTSSKYSCSNDRTLPVPAAKGYVSTE